MGPDKTVVLITGVHPPVYLEYRTNPTHLPPNTYLSIDILLTHHPI